MSNELEKDLTINIENLIEEWIQLPSIYFAYREEADYLDISMRKQKMKLDFAIAELDGKVRKEPAIYLGVEKPTENQIKCYIESHEDVFSIREKMLETEKKRKLLVSACNALEMKKDALKNLTNLQNSEYFSLSSVKTDFTDIVQNGQEKVSRNIRREILGRLNNNNK